MADDRQIGDEDLMDITRDEASARFLRKALQKLADSPSGNGALQEMAREVLAGRIGLREAVQVGAYSEALGEGMLRVQEAMDRQSSEEREQQRAEGERHLRAQQEEIDQERREAAQARPASDRAARHSGRDWKL
ncbi:hypothetical protein P8605_03250 [Streptomyces sp. T-3]|nr:hypothetical protein [Streptomyces sp. T-3]